VGSLCLGLSAQGAAAEGAGAAGALEAIEGHDCGGLGCLHGKLESESGGVFDAATGGDHRNFPPDRLVDHLHLLLRLRFEDLDAKRFTAEQELRVRGIAPRTVILALDAVGLSIQGVTRDGAPTTFFADGREVFVTLDPPLESGQEALLGFVYECVEPPRGMIFTPSDPRTGRAAEVHTQGQPEQNRHWFIGHDFPNERLSSELIIDLPAGLVASGNGRLIAQQEIDGRSIWHWKQEKPHVNYLVALVAGDFERVLIAPGSNGIPMTVWIPPGRAGDVERTFGRTGRMMDLFERRFGLAYPWARYDQLVVRNFGAGGMENTTATTLHPFSLLDEAALLDGDLDGLIAHELAHQWFGDLITCRSWTHIWLNEGWATYSSALWNEERFGEDGYLDSIHGNFSVAQRDLTTGLVPMVCNEWRTPGETFGRVANPYSKGSSILHMLRMMLGEEVFWEAVHRYVQRHQDSVVETDDFRHALEEISGQDLEWFFEQWCMRPGTPALKAVAVYDAGRGDVVVNLEQAQQIDARTPAFRFELPVLVRTSSGDRTHVISMRERRAVGRIAVDSPPQMIVIDPHLHVLKTLELDLPPGLLLAQAESGPTIAARRAAVAALAGADRPDTRASLERIARHGQRRHTESAQALEVLGGFASAEARERVLAIFDDGIEEARVRKAAVAALSRQLEGSGAPGPTLAHLVPRLVGVATSDPSADCRVAAIRRLGALEAAELGETLHALLAVPSHGEKVRLAALSALAERNDPRALDPAIESSRFGVPDRARPEAIAAVGRLGTHDRQKAIDALLPLLDDPERRSVLAAGSALASLRAAEARSRMAALSESGPSWVREQAKEWLRRLDETP
jgi:aminopeptidase N